MSLGRAKLLMAVIQGTASREDFDPMELEAEANGWCMKGGGSSPSTTTTVQKADPWEGQMPYLTDIYGRAQTAADQTSTEAYTGDLIAKPTQGMLDAQQMRRNYLPAAQQAGNSLVQLGQDTAAGKYLDGSSWIMPAVQAQVRPMVDQLQRQMLPQLASDAFKSGSYGGSRQGVLEANMITDTGRNISDTAMKAIADNYARERQYQMGAGDIIQAGINLPVGLSQQIGQVEQGWSQDQIDEALMQYQMALEAPWQAINPYAGIVMSGYPGGASNSVQSVLNSPNRVAGALGGAAAGGLGAYGLSQMAPSTFGFLGGAGGIGAGAGLGALAGAFL